MSDSLPSTYPTSVEQADDTRAANVAPALPILKTKIVLSEERGQVVLDISDSTGNLGLKVFLDGVTANLLGYAMMEKSRALCALTSDDPARTQAQEFVSPLVYNGIMPGPGTKIGKQE